MVTVLPLCIFTPCNVTLQVLPAGNVYFSTLNSPLALSLALSRGLQWKQQSVYPEPRPQALQASTLTLSTQAHLLDEGHGAQVSSLSPNSQPVAGAETPC